MGRARVYDNEDRKVYLASGYPVEQMIIEGEETEGIGKLLGLWYNRGVIIFIVITSFFYRKPNIIIISIKRIIYLKNLECHF